MTNENLPHYRLGWRGTTMLIIGAFLPILVISTASALSLVIFKTDLEYNTLLMMLSNALMWCGAIFAFDRYSCRPETGQKLKFNFSVGKFSTYLIIFPLMLGMMFISEGITSLIPISGPVFGKLYQYFSSAMDSITSDPYSMVILTVIMAPIFEEIVFRGIIMKGMINGEVKPQKAIIISAVVFGLIHGNPWQFVGAVLLGCVLGNVYYRTKSLLNSMLLHGFNNLCSVLLITYSKTESFADTLHLPVFVIALIGLVVFIVFFYLFQKKKSY